MQPFHSRHNVWTVKPQHRCMFTFLRVQGLSNQCRRAAVWQGPPQHISTARLTLMAHSLATTPAQPALEQQLMDRARDTRTAISTVESCTGGYLAHLLTNVRGAAAVYWGSVVVYDGSLKTHWAIPACHVHEPGTVSDVVARELAENGLKRMMGAHDQGEACSDLAEPTRYMCLSTTGFAGGAPKEEESGQDVHVSKVHAPGSDPNDRVKHKEFFAARALELALKCL